MTPDYCELDPDGDVILILERRHEEDEGEEGVPTDDPLSPTEEAPAEEAPAEWIEEAPAEEAPAEEAPADEAPAEWIEEALAEDAPAEWIEAAPAEDPPAEWIEEAPAEEAPAEEAPAEEALAEEAPAEWPASEEIPVDDPPAPTGGTLTGDVRDSEKQPKSEHIRMRVSSKHLILASPYFRNMLQGDFKEGVDLDTTGAAEIPLVGDHPAALLILLNIIHGHTRRVPRDVDLRMLTWIAILVSKYEFHEVAEMFTDTWVEKLKGSMPISLTDDLRAVICIYWVFRKSSEFKRATQIALMDSNDRIEEDGLPIPSSVFGNIRIQCSYSRI
jgi:hypothetical protein